MSNLVPVTVIILTRNEEQNIGDCLRRLDWADEVIVVDSFSTDRTIELAKAARADVRIMQNEFEDFGHQRNFAMDQSSPKHEWILFLDADERCTEKLADEIRQTIRSTDAVGYYISCRNFFLGRWIKRCTLYPSFQLRLLKLGHVRYRKEGHGQQEVTEGKTDYLKAPYDHYGFSKGLHNWIARHNDYSSNEVELIHRLRSEPLKLGSLFRGAVERRRALKRLASRTNLIRPWARFFYLYFCRFGFLDGRPGLLFCWLRLAQEFHIIAKLREHELEAQREKKTTD